MTTTELKSARIQWMAAHSNILDIYMSAMNDPEELEKAIKKAERFIAASNGLIYELRQNEGGCMKAFLILIISAILVGCSKNEPDYLNSKISTHWDVVQDGITYSNLTGGIFFGNGECGFLDNSGHKMFFKGSFSAKQL